MEDSKPQETVGKVSQDQTITSQSEDTIETGEQDETVSGNWVAT